MISIELRNVRIHAFHGMYEGEEKLGNDFIVNIAVKYEEHLNDLDDLNNTVDYVNLFDIVKKRMQVPTVLLEKVCDGIVRHVKHQYSFVREIDISVYKLQPPIPQFEGRVGVSMNKKFND